MQETINFNKIQLLIAVCELYYILPTTNYLFDIKTANIQYSKYIEK